MTPLSLARLCFRQLSSLNVKQKIIPFRPPVVTIMGHVDHGKTTLLDFLRKSSIAAGEAGGITQHIGAFSVDVSSKDGGQIIGNSINRITFLDTPGHAAFSRIRERGAQVTDIVVLVVAADDGIMAQTIESIKYAKDANVPIVVAISKSDKFGPSQATKIKEDLLRIGVICEDFGGDTQAVAVSGLTGLNMSQLLEALIVQGELLELRADPTTLVRGAIIESRIKTGLGECATMLVMEGTLRPGNILVAEDSICRVRSILDHTGSTLSQALPSTPVEVSGWKSLPRVGATVIQVTLDSEAEEIAESYRKLQKELELEKSQSILKERQVLHDKMWQIKRESLSRDSSTPMRATMSYEDFSEESSDTAKPVLKLIIKSILVRIAN